MLKTSWRHHATHCYNEYNDKQCHQNFNVQCSHNCQKGMKRCEIIFTPSIFWIDINWKRLFVSPLNISCEISDLCSFCFFFQFGNEEAKMTTEEIIVTLILLYVNHNVKKWKIQETTTYLIKMRKSILWLKMYQNPIPMKIH